jgi:ABC-type sugar transport system ATPase subunit
VRLVEPLGKETLLYCDYGGDKSLIAIVEGTQRFQTGEQLELACDPRRLYLFGADGKRIR